jgi:hypothetical protein
MRRPAAHALDQELAVSIVPDSVSASTCGRHGPFAWNGVGKDAVIASQRATWGRLSCVELLRIGDQFRSTSSADQSQRPPFEEARGAYARATHSFGSVIGNDGT